MIDIKKPQGLFGQVVEVEEDDSHLINDEIVKCSNDPIYFLKSYVKIVTVDDGIRPFDTFKYQDDILRLLEEENRLIAMLPRQMGKTTIMAGYILWYVIFNSDKNVGIVANTFKVAKEIIDRVKSMYDTLPDFLKITKEKWNIESIELSNGSKVMASATSSDAFSGFSINLLLIDEVAKITKGKWNKFYTSVYPTISSGKTSKIVMISTPLGMNHFYNFWKGAEDGTNNFKPYRAYWQDRPKRDEAWKLATIKSLNEEEGDGEARFLQEFECEFLGQTGSLIPAGVLKQIVTEEPLKTDGIFEIYEAPEEGRTYITIADFSEGVGSDFSVFNIFDITDWIKLKKVTQVAMYRNNLLSIIDAPEVLASVAKIYNNSYVIGENNSIGQGILDNLLFGAEYDFVYMDDKGNTGIMMNTRSKKIAVSMLRSYMLMGTIGIKCSEAVKELSNFIKVGTTYKAKEGNDDIAMTLALLSYVLSENAIMELVLNKEITKEKKEDVYDENFVKTGVKRETVRASLDKESDSNISTVISTRDLEDDPFDDLRFFND